MRKLTKDNKKKVIMYHKFLKIKMILLFKMIKYKLPSKMRLTGYKDKLEQEKPIKEIKIKTNK
jgi:hypothetical protein